MFSWLWKTKPYETGFLTVDDGYKIFYQLVGNPKGIPVLVFNGGPGFANDYKRTKYLDLSKHKMILCDQRGTGGSVHNSGDVIYNNTTDDLLDDAMKIIKHLNLKTKIVVAGVSWGATLALLFAQKYPEVVGKIISIATFNADEQYARNWFENGARLFYPDIIAQLKEQAQSDNFTKYYNDLMFSDKNENVRKALLFYGAYEEMLGQKNPKFNFNKEIHPWEVNRLKIALHYDTNNYFLKTNQILENMNKIQHIPLLMIHNRMDFICPVLQAWEIYIAHPISTLHIVPELGHGAGVMKKIPKKLVQKFLQNYS